MRIKIASETLSAQKRANDWQWNKSGSIEKGLHHSSQIKPPIGKSP